MITIYCTRVIHTDVHMKTELQITSEEVTNDKELEGTSPSY